MKNGADFFSRKHIYAYWNSIVVIDGVLHMNKSYLKEINIEKEK